MKYAASIYKGGTLIDATFGNYQDYKDKGLICPFCNEAVYWVRGHIRGNYEVAPAWHHYKMSSNSVYCEKRSLTSQGKEELKQLQSQAKGQRLKLFNRRFIEIYMHKKSFGMSYTKMKRLCNKALGEDCKMVLEVSKQNWDPDLIVSKLPETIRRISRDERVIEAIAMHPAFNPDFLPASEVKEQILPEKYPVLRMKILSEVVHWIVTDSAKDAWEFVMLGAILDYIEVTRPPYDLGSIAEMLLFSFTLTDWVEAINSLPEPTRGLGF